jgi:hypothetical protein
MSSVDFQMKCPKCLGDPDHQPGCVEGGSGSLRRTETRPMLPAEMLMLPFSYENRQYNSSPSTWLTDDLLDPTRSLPTLDASVDLEELVDKRGRDNFCVGKSAENDSAGTSPASDWCVGLEEVIESSEVMNTSELLIKPKQVKSVEVSEEVIDGGQMASKLERARAAYLVSVSHVDNSCATIVRATEESGISEVNVGQVTQQGEDHPVLEKKIVPIRMIIRKGVAIIVESNSEGQVEIEQARGVQDNPEVLNIIQRVQDSPSDDVRGERGRDNPRERENMRGVVDSPERGNNEIDESGKGMPDSECTPERVRSVDSESVRGGLIESPDSPDNPFDRGDLDMEEIGTPVSDSDMEEPKSEPPVRQCMVKKVSGWVVTEGYCLMTSPISEVESGDRIMAPSKVQRYWTRSQARKQGKGIRVAKVRPSQYQNGRYVTVRRQYRQRQFRIETMAPVIQTNVILSRVTAADGSMAERTHEHRILMARTSATQTRLLRMVLSRSLIHQVNIPGDNRTEEVVDVSSVDEGQEEDIEPVCVSDESSVEDMDSGNPVPEEDTSPGTPLQDEQS